MAENSKIGWTDHTFNPWWGCNEVSPACDNCYARVFDHRLGFDHWGPDHKRREFGDKHWNEPLKWNRKAEKEGARRKVFCASMADWADKFAPAGARERLFELIKATQWLDWQLLTKRIGNVPDMLPADWGDGYPNVWLMITVANQQEADRDIPKLLKIPARIHGLSMEPLLSQIDVRRFLWPVRWSWDARFDSPEDALAAGAYAELKLQSLVSGNARFIRWGIVGGESGYNARRFVLGYAKDIVRQFKNSQTAIFVKQMGSNPVNREGQRCPHIKEKSGLAMSEWPEELRVQEFPA